ncbi:arylsulfotransferase family protein [Myxococcota bacterium]|nr:arylsulfotransferase family protein [Myxococcota bacterium]
MTAALLSLLLACQPATVDNDDDGGTDTGDGGATDGGTSGGDGGTDGGDGGTGDGGTLGDGGQASDFFDGLQWRLHDEMGSLVYVSWSQQDAATVHVEYSFDDGEWHQSPPFSAAAGSNEQLLVGIPFDMRARWRVKAETGETEDGPDIETDEVPSGVPEGTLEVSEPDRWLPDHGYLLTSINEQTGGWTGGHYWTLIVDRKARPVWASEAPREHWTLFAQVSVTGDYILWDEATYWSDWDHGAGSTVHRTWLDGEFDEIETPGLHHAFVQLPDETLVWGSQDHGGGEALVEQPMGSSDQTVLWTCQGDWPNSGDCESNGLFYVEETNSFLYSFYTNNSLVEVDRATGQSLWWAGEVRGGYTFDPADTQFSWQHGISYTEAGTLLVSTEASAMGRNTTMVREYEVDHETGTLHHVWNYDPGVFASTNGDAWRLENGNTLHVVGSAGHVFEVDAAGVPVWHVDYDGSHLMGRGELISDLYALVSPAARHE